MVADQKQKQHEEIEEELLHKPVCLCGFPCVLSEPVQMWAFTPPSNTDDIFFSSLPKFTTRLPQHHK